MQQLDVHENGCAVFYCLSLLVDCGLLIALHQHHTVCCCNVLHVSCLQGPLQSLTVESISWRSAARSRQGRSSDAGSSDSGSNSSTQQASAWLPIRVSGVHVVLAAAAEGRSKGSKQRKPHAASSAARSAAAWPAVSTALAAAKRLLPGMPMRLQDVKVELKVRNWDGCESWLLCLLAHAPCMRCMSNVVHAAAAGRGPAGHVFT